MRVWASAAEIAQAVADGKTTAVEVAQAALARIAERDKTLNAFTAVTRERALAKARAVDADKAAGRALGPLAGVPFAVKNLFDVAGLATLAGSKINRDRAPATADCHSDPAARGGRRRAGRRAQHGRVRLRLHRRERARRALAQPARHQPHDGRLLGRHRRRGGRRPGADRARLRHQRLDPRAVLVLRPVRPQADLRPAVARRHLPVRGELRPSGPSGAQRARPGAGLRRHAGPRPRGSRVRQARPGAGVAADRAGPERPAHRRGRRLFRARRVARGPGRRRARGQGAGRHARDRDPASRAAHAPRPSSSPPARAPRCISIACARGPPTSIPPCATG